MRTIVLDTNCLLIALPSKSPYHKVWADILDGKAAWAPRYARLQKYNPFECHSILHFYPNLQQPIGNGVTVTILSQDTLVVQDAQSALNGTGALYSVFFTEGN